VTLGESLLVVGIGCRAAENARKLAGVDQLPRRAVDGWNERCQPFTWTKTPRKSTSGTRHQADLTG
jgi:hypothetical protein